MEARGQILSCWQWSSSGGHHLISTQHRFPLAALNLLRLPGAVTYGSFGKRWASTHHLPVLAFHAPPRAQHQDLERRRKEELESLVWSRFGFPHNAAGSPRRPWVITTSVAPVFVSPEDTSISTRKKHAEQLEEFYMENEFLFVDETWAWRRDEDCCGEISQPVKEKLSLLLAAGRVQTGARVLVWGGSAAFVRELLVTTSPGSVVVTHFSISVLGTVKEMKDDVICWLGDIQDLPDSYGPFETVFINSVLATACSPVDVLRGVASFCNHGARIVIGCTQGKEDLAACRESNPNLMLRSLPNGSDLETMVNVLPLSLVALQDEESFYLAILGVDLPQLCA